MDAYIKMLKREKEWYEKNYDQFNHDESERKGFINGIDYCINFLVKSQELSDHDENPADIILKRTRPFPEKTLPCPACGKQLITPKEYFPALTKMNEEISKYREVLIKDYEIDRSSKTGCCPQCEDKPIHHGIGTCTDCDSNNKIATKLINKYLSDGHTDHCSKRIVWGDGECECGKDEK